MRVKIAIASLIFATTFLGACATDIEVVDNGNDTCTQIRKKQGLGITYSKTENFVNCESVGLD